MFPISESPRQTFPGELSVNFGDGFAGWYDDSYNFKRVFPLISDSHRIHGTNGIFTYMNDHEWLILIYQHPWSLRISENNIPFSATWDVQYLDVPGS